MNVQTDGEFVSILRTIMQETLYNSSAWYTCDPGYDLIGPSSLTCSSSGHWLDRSKPLSFGTPSSQSSSMKHQFSNPSLVDDRASSGAGLGILLGSFPPICHRRECPKPYQWFLRASSNIGDANRRPRPTGRPRGWHPGDAVRFHCPRGSVLRGKKAALCQEDGTWQEAENV